MRLLPLALLTLAAAGCALDYRGTSPSLRTFYDDATVHQYFYGLDLNFAVVDPPGVAQPTTRPADPQPPQDPDRLPKPLPEPPFVP